MFNFLRSKAKQLNREVIDDGGVDNVAMTRAKQLLTADWKTELILAGYGYGVPLVDISAGAAPALITGGGAGTTIDTDQPEMAVGTPTGYYHIPLFFQLSVKVDTDADAEMGEVILFADTAKTIPAPVLATSVPVTPVPLLGGGAAAISLAETTVSADITDPVCSMPLGYWTTRLSEVTAAGEVIVVLNAIYNPDFPQLFKGPCSVIACWGGTAAVTAGGTYMFAEVPIARFTA